MGILNGYLFVTDSGYTYEVYFDAHTDKFPAEVLNDFAIGWVSTVVRKELEKIRSWGSMIKLVQQECAWK
jgi:hypothetical protein